MRVQRREERKIKIIAGRVRVMWWVSSIISDWVRVRVSFEMRAQRGEER